MRKGSVEHTYIEVGEQKIPAKIYREMRRTVRFAIAKRGAILRLPLLLHPQDQHREITNFRHWVQKQVASQQKLQDHFTPKAYRSGDTLEVGKRTYIIIVEETQNTTHSASLKNNHIHLRLASGDSDLNRQKAIKHLLSRVVAQDFTQEIAGRVLEINQRHFQKAIRSINLKYNVSNWGSCSSKGNINLSTRLLFAPDSVIDYVIIHELAHLVEMNHSPKFWQIVERIMPDYPEKETWLKKNWQVCDF